MSVNRNKTRVVLYCRVSTKEQADEGYSLEAQEKLLRAYAEQHDFKIVKTYKIAETASKEFVRKSFKEVFDFVSKNKIDAILVEKIDRLTRNLKDAGVADDWVHQAPNREIHFVKESFVLNRNTRAHENLVWDMKVAIARFYSNNLSEEVKKGVKEKIEQGHSPVNYVFGYKSVGEKGHKVHVVDEPLASVVQDAFERYATGNYSLSRLEEQMYADGVRTKTGKRVSISTWHKILRNPFYHGYFKWKGELYPGKHQPLISEDLFNKVQSLLNRKTLNPHFAKHYALFKAKMFCEGCGGLVTWYIQKGRWYGHCNNTHRYKNCVIKTCIRQDKAEEQIIPLFDLLSPKFPELLYWVEDTLKVGSAKEVVTKEQQVTNVREELRKLNERKDRLYEAKLNKDLPADICDQKLSECLQEEKALQEALQKLTEQSGEYEELKILLHRLAYNAKAIYEKASPDDKRLLLSQIFTNFTQNRTEIRPNYTPAGDYLKNWMPRLSGNYELQKTASIKEKTPESSDVISFGSPNRTRLEQLFEVFRATDWAKIKGELYALKPTASLV